MKVGSIIINEDYNLNAILTTDWRDIIGVIPQDVTIFSGNVVSNILLGKEDTPENIENFAKTMVLKCLLKLYHKVMLLF